MRAAIVGCGAVARTHLRTLKRMGDIELAALCDKDQRAATAMSKEWNVGHYYTDPCEMLEKENLSIVSILTPPQFHASIAIEAIRRQVNVLVEKPLAMTSREAQQVLDSLKGSCVKLTVNHDWLFSKVMMDALHLYRTGALGKVLQMEVKVLHTQDDPMASNQNHWCHRILGGRFGEMLAHPVYLIQSILGYDLQIDRVLANKLGSYPWMTYDELHITLRRERVPGYIYVSFNSPRPAITIDIYGTLQILKIDPMNQIAFKSGPRTFSKMDSAKNCLGLSCQLLLATVRNALRYLLLEQGEYGLRFSYMSLIDSIKTDREPLVTPTMAYNAVRTVEEICQEI